MRLGISSIVLLQIFFLTGGAVGSSNFCSITQEIQSYLVGASYVTFWGTGMDIDWSTGAVYTPILGNYSSNNSSVANQHIQWALDNGVDFFFLDYGWARAPDKDRMESAALDGLLKSNRMKDFNFSICYFPYRIVTDRQINETALSNDFLHLNQTYFSNPSYITINNKHLLILVDFPLYFADGNKSSGDIFIAKMNELFFNLTDTYQLYLVFAFWPNLKHDNICSVLNSSTNVYEAITLWGNNTIIEFNETISYAEYYNKTETNFIKWAEIARDFEVDFVPLICPGYNNLLYYDIGKIDWWAIVNRDLGGFRQACQLAGEYASQSNNKMVLLLTWNDFKEGTSIEPTIDYGAVFMNSVSLIPEFPFQILTIFMIMTLLVVITYRRKLVY